jgi:hypothetical protein
LLENRDGVGEQAVTQLEGLDTRHGALPDRVAYEAFEKALGNRTDAPDIVVFVETDGYPMYGWMFKEDELLGDDIPMPTWHRCYTDGQID